MQGARWTSLAVVSLLSAGCAVSELKVGIPVGEWQGQGFFVYDEWGSEEEATSQPSSPTSLSRTYPTRLTIRQVTSGGHDFIELDILSERGPLPELGEQTHLKVALARAKSVTDAATLYRVVDWDFNPAAHESLDLGKQDAPVAASCLRQGGTTVLTIRYDEDFNDTFRFRGNSLVKDGLLYGDNGLIHWSETLKRR